MINTIGPVGTGTRSGCSSPAVRPSPPSRTGTRPCSGASTSRCSSILLSLIIPRGRVRVPGQAGRGTWRSAGTRDLHRLPAARDPVGRRIRQRAARHPAERGPRLHRQLLHTAQPVLAARRADHAHAFHPTARSSCPEDHGRPAPPGEPLARPLALLACCRGGSSPGPGPATGAWATSARASPPYPACRARPSRPDRASREPGWPGGHGLPAPPRVLAATGALFTALYPHVLPSTINPAYSLTTANAASAAKTLAIMTVVACIFLPLVLALPAWRTGCSASGSSGWRRRAAHDSEGASPP